MARPISITLPLPSPKLSPNARVHWRSKAEATKRSRMASALEAQAHSHHVFDPLPSATLRRNFYWPDKRRRDRDNAEASCKAYIDGLVDAGLLEDDCGVTYLPSGWYIDKENPRLVIEVFTETTNA